MLITAQVLENYKQLFENLTMYRGGILQVFSSDVPLKTFNAVHGLAKMHVFRHMFHPARSYFRSCQKNRGF